MDKVKLPNNVIVREGTSAWDLLAEQDRKIIYVACTDNEQYAEQIKTAINSHEELLASCKAHKNHLELLGQTEGPAYYNVCLALQKAGA